MGCHRTLDSKYPVKTRLSECSDCHSPLPDPPDIKGNGRIIRISVSRESGFNEATREDVEAYAKKYYAEKGFRTAQAGEYPELVFTFRIDRVEDPLVKKTSGLVLLRGSCDAVVGMNREKRESFRVVSKVKLTDTPPATRKWLIGYLVRKALMESTYYFDK